MRLVSSLKKSIKYYLQTRNTYKFFLKDWIGLRDLNACADVVKTMRFSRNLDPLVIDVPAGKKIMVIAPHPDDEILGAGGTLIKSIRNGSEVFCLYLTAGPPHAAEALQDEAKRVSKHIGYSIGFLPYHSKQIPLADAGEAIAQHIMKFQPELLFVPNLLDDHDDHRRASHILMAAYNQKKLENDKIEIWAYQVYTSLWPNVVVDITNVKDEKADAVGMWVSQSQKRNWAHFILGLNAYNSRFLRSSAQRHYVETFFVVPFREYAELCSIYFSRDPGQCYYSRCYSGND